MIDEVYSVRSLGLVFVDPLLDVVHLDSSGLGKGNGVEVGWRAEVQVMGTAFDEQGNTGTVSSYVVVKTTSSPWVKLSIGEDNVCCREEVLVDVVSTEVVKSPVVVRGEAESILAHFRVAVIIE